MVGESYMATNLVSAKTCIGLDNVSLIAINCNLVS
jgi:hypothetical protein